MMWHAGKVPPPRKPHSAAADLLLCHILIILLVVSCSADATKHHRHNHNKHAQHKEDFEIVVPYRADESGHYISDRVVLHEKRQKRSSSSSNENSDDEEKLYINFSGFNQKFHLALIPQKGLLAPGFKVYHRKNDLSIPVEDNFIPGLTGDDNGCLYTGWVMSHSNRPVAVSLCKGVEGLIRTPEEDYVIEPIKVPGSWSTRELLIGQPHKMYRTRTMINKKKIPLTTEAKTDRHSTKSEKELNNTTILWTRAKSITVYSPPYLRPNNHYLQNTRIRTNLNWITSGVDRLRNYHNINHRLHTSSFNLRTNHHRFYKNNSRLSSRKRHRRRRSTDKWQFRGKEPPRTVETLVTVDRDLLTRHQGRENVTLYVLTLFSMVSQLFLDSSIGVPIKIVLVGLVILETDEPGLHIVHHADRTLNNFCTWQAAVKGDHGRQHDNAVLLTGKDICSNKEAPCDTLGFAPIGGMCSRLRSCTVNEDTGLITAFTVAHEMGHNFGMYHDGDGNYCKTTSGFMMAPALHGRDGRLSWSVCSRAYLRRFLNSPRSVCLNNEARFISELRFPNKLPGVLYDASVQCQWMFDQNSSLCPYKFGKQDVCKMLWCYRGSQKCETKFLPAADGTSCGTKKWCRHGQCREYRNGGPDPVDGGWASWSSWSACSQSCGSGTQYQERLCTSPLAKYGGKECDGDSSIHQICNSKICPSGTQSLSSHQCATYNNKRFQGVLLEWKPNYRLYKASEPCRIFCKADTYRYVFTLKLAALDGMKCGRDYNNICVEGICKKVGCDRIVDSLARLDKCGICSGDNTTCDIIRGSFEQQPRLSTYFPIVVLPKGARNLRIVERKRSPNFLAIRNIYGKYYINGRQQILWPGRYIIAGAEFLYKRPYNDVERIYSNGPLDEDLVLEVLVQGDNPGIYYEYALNKSLERPVPTRSWSNNVVNQHQYRWSVSVTKCSVPCAGGNKTITASCHRDDSKSVDDGYCEESTKPRTGMFSCNRRPCRARWSMGEWTQCSRLCGGGKQKRKVQCMQALAPGKERRLRRKYCYREERPKYRQLCNMHDCDAAWVMGKWTNCSSTCGMGRQIRKVKCRQRTMMGTKRLRGAYCQAYPKPLSVKTCLIELCEQVQYNWEVTAWSECSVTCGTGSHTRTLQCIRVTAKESVLMKTAYCRHLRKPSITYHELCNVKPCTSALRTEPEWHLEAWAQCSITCGMGFQQRHVWCRDSIKWTPRAGCKGASRPISTQKCWSGHCPQQAEPIRCEDRYNWCHLVVKRKMCKHHFYGGRCCKSCSES